MGERGTYAIEDVAAAAAKLTEIQVPDVKEHIVAIWLIERPIRSLGESNMAIRCRQYSLLYIKVPQHEL